MLLHEQKACQGIEQTRLTSRHLQSFAGQICRLSGIEGFGLLPLFSFIRLGYGDHPGRIRKLLNIALQPFPRSLGAAQMPLSLEIAFGYPAKPFPRMNRIGLFERPSTIESKEKEDFHGS
jgi:hypothetical protein